MNMDMFEIEQVIQQENTLSRHLDAGRLPKTYYSSKQIDLNIEFIEEYAEHFEQATNILDLLHQVKEQVDAGEGITILAVNY